MRKKQVTVQISQAELSLLGADLIQLFDLSSIPMNAFCNITITRNGSWVNKFPTIFKGTGLHQHRTVPSKVSLLFCY